MGRQMQSHIPRQSSSESSYLHSVREKSWKIDLSSLQKVGQGKNQG